MIIVKGIDLGPLQNLRQNLQINYFPEFDAGLKRIDIQVV